MHDLLTFTYTWVMVLSRRLDMSEREKRCLGLVFADLLKLTAVGIERRPDLLVRLVRRVHEVAGNLLADLEGA